MTMAVLFGWILSRSKFWRDHTNLRIITISTAARKHEAERMISQLLEYCRIEARVLVLLLENEELPDRLTPEELNRAFLLDVSQERRCAIFNHLIIKHSYRAGIVFFPIADPPKDPKHARGYINTLNILSKGVTTPTILVRGCADVITSDI
eukprot:CAMPEP_0117010806 /NCGR_PEP_ID=MMETSP0472-20121206/9428_1 /TAXON_ID=693140 ORGANISM="Tiarina fusus, Strain LIS" /NCGR_SAMPLE_ID=MMETSP0472 /ASSEMBLY_ACC=CAM_ASM_000603 /LENGTH=150 /DNA_ID=CAMNT_0004713427 /DNA_START=930 /DNA_END=1382 /DNA_ORIENTATION=-